MQQKLQALQDKLRLIDIYSRAINILHFDFETIVPSGAREKEADAINYFSNEMFKLQTAEDIKALVEDLYRVRADLDPLDRRLVENMYVEQQKVKNVTPQLFMEMSEIASRAYSTWLQAKAKQDFSLFADVLGEVVAMQRKIIMLRDDKLPDYYDNCLDDSEKGLLQADLDPFFASLKEGLVSLLNRIQCSKHFIREDFLSRKVPIHKQEEFSRYLLTLNGYDFAKGALSTTEHPFTIPIGQNDARVTTHYHEDMFASNVYSVIHEGGHAIFMQEQRPQDFEHHINDLISNGMHESVSRFYENVIGRSKAYIHLIYPEFHRIFADELGDVSERELYEAVNIVRPSLVRTEADEVTYGLHIIIRYEMEKAIANGTLAVADAKDKWNALYKQYLGVDVPNDAMGILQDVHWTSGFGYFPSYALGNCYNAMYLDKLKKELDLDALVASGDMARVKSWLKDNVFVHANMLSPKEWLWELTGKALSPEYFLDYLERKYKDIYQLD